jgi:hypothetical protein
MYIYIYIYIYIYMYILNICLAIYTLNSCLLQNEKIEVRQNSSKARGEICLSLEQDDARGAFSDVYLEMLVSNFDQETKYPKFDL